MTALTHRKPGARRGIQLYGWDSRTGTWSGPTGLGPAGRASKRLLNTLRNVSGKSWFGREWALLMLNLIQQGLRR